LAVDTDANANSVLDAVFADILDDSRDVNVTPVVVVTCEGMFSAVVKTSDVLIDTALDDVSEAAETNDVNVPVGNVSLELVDEVVAEGVALAALVTPLLDTGAEEVTVKRAMVVVLDVGGIEVLFCSWYCSVAASEVLTAFVVILAVVAVPVATTAQAR
jgi:hypothetical protein